MTYRLAWKGAGCSLRLDADVLAWLKDGQGDQTRVNQILRERVLEDLEGQQGSAGSEPHPSPPAKLAGTPVRDEWSGRNDERAARCPAKPESS